MIRLWYFKALFLFWTFVIIYYIIKTLCCKCDLVTESGSFYGVHQIDLHWGQKQRWHPKHYELHNRWWKESKIIRVLSNTMWHSFHYTTFCTNNLHSTWCSSGINNDVWERLYVIHLLAVYFYCLYDLAVNPLTPNDHYSSRTAPLTYKRCILYIYSTNIGTEYFKHGIYCPFLSL